MNKSRPRAALLHRLFPFLHWAGELRGATLHADLMAGITGAVIVLPQGVAYAMIAGLPPQFGLYSAIVIPIVAGLFGSSRHLVSGPTAAISVLVASVLAGMSIAEGDYIALALTLTLLAGVFQLGFGLARMGALVNFISHTVIVGFTAGAALIIALSQTGNLLGLPAGGPSGLKAFAVVAAAPPPHLATALGLFAFTLVSCQLIRKLRPRWPALLLAMIAGSLLGVVIGAGEQGVPMVGAIPSGLPPLSVPAFTPEVLQSLVPGALAVALLGLIEAVSIARAIGLRSHQRIDSNQEFIGQGLSNIVGSFFSSYAASGSFTRSGANYEAGARTPLAGIFASLVLVVIVLSFPQASAWLPIPVVAAIIVLIAWGLLDFTTIRRIVHASREETAVLGATFLAAIVINLEFAIITGVALSLFLYLRRTSQPGVIPVAPHPDRPAPGLRNARKHGLPEDPRLRILRLDGSLFFGAVEHVQGQLQRLSADQKRILLVCSGVNFIDLAGAEMLLHEARRLRREGGALYLCGLRDTARRKLQQGRFLDALGRDHIFGDPARALAALLPDEPPSPGNTPQTTETKGQG
ncbi:SulP family inorganic anion transporter [Alkalilimnicola sp. S0819]|uniref:SulP family inorganic anion transporter n=1 Tax=Alkalilimnicola sp. S0819 TaxID=2613922 RepID=UPI001D011037|nr:SulP family inorganic anion transporter [Alkalilimnicola sp. S0819]